MKKYLRWINLSVVSGDKCNSGIKRRNCIYWKLVNNQQGQNEKVCLLVE